MLLASNQSYYSVQLINILACDAIANSVSLFSDSPYQIFSHYLILQSVNMNFVQSKQMHIYKWFLTYELSKKIYP